jgi:formylglycine-generating enzyme required for sulfatase activity
LASATLPNPDTVQRSNPPGGSITSQTAQAPLPTYTPYPTYTPLPLPTYTPYPTYTPLPLPTETPSSWPAGFQQTNSIDGAILVYVPGGEFVMGSNPNEPYFWGAESPKHTVFLDSFWIYQTEVTNQMYRLCVQAGKCSLPSDLSSTLYPDYFNNPQYDDYPVINVNFNQAQVYCQWAGGRLPTEAEWEKAARGSDGRLFPWGNQELQANYANFCDINCALADNPEQEVSLDDGYGDVAPVGSFPAGASPYGIYDMAGNVLEWVQDWMNQSYYSSSPYENPRGPASGTRRVIRGGSWWSGRAGLRTSARASWSPDKFSSMIGFRCAH